MGHIILRKRGMLLLMCKRLIVISIFFFFITTQLLGQEERLLKIPENSIDELRILQHRYGLKLRYRTTDFSIIQADRSALPELHNAQILDTVVPGFDYYIVFLRRPDARRAIARYGAVLDQFNRFYLIRLPTASEGVLLSVPTHHRAKLPAEIRLDPADWLMRASSNAPSTQQQTIINGFLKQVDVNRWFTEVKALTANEDLARPGSFFRSRYSLRVREAKQFDGTPKPDHACDNAADYIAQQFRSYGLEVEFDPFLHRRRALSGALIGEYVLQNVVATLPGKGPNRERMYLMTAHYDSISSKTPGWQQNWRTLSAPGASDNASGVAEMLETARILSRHDFDFTIKFIAFSGEELFLFGSRHYRDLVEQRGDKVAGVLNFDLLGHDQDGILDIHVLGDDQSQWLVNAFGTAADRYNIKVDLREKNDPGFIFSDHSPFWEIGIPAVMVAEESSFDALESTEYIHSQADTLEKITLPLGELAIKLAVATLSELARPMATPEAADAVAPDIFWEPTTISVSNPTPTKGELVELSATVKNGGPVAVNGILVQFAAVRPDQVIEQIAEQRVNLDVGGGQIVQATFTPMAWGQFTLRAVVNDDTTVFESEFGNNRIETPLIVTDSGVVIENVIAYPNPISFNRWDAALKLSYVLSRDADVTVSIYTMLGEKVFDKSFTAGDNGGKLGLNAHFNWKGRNVYQAKVANGIYLCQITATDPAGQSKHAKTKIAVTW